MWSNAARSSTTSIPSWPPTRSTRRCSPLAFPLDEQPTSLAEMAAMAPELDGKIGTVNVTNANAGLGTYGYIDAYGEEGWAVLEELGPHSGVEDGTGALLGKLQSG